jgi:hypothetical protein
MATKPTMTVAAQFPGPQHYVPPTARELRTQSVQRLQAGLFGLAAMLLLVGLANIIMDRARVADVAAGMASPVSSAAASGGAASDPLADIGVMPAGDPGATSSAVPAPSGGAPAN